MNVLETVRLRLRRLDEHDAAFILELLNEPAFLEHVGDRNLRTLADAAIYIRNGPVASYAQHGFGMLLVESKEFNQPVGICGLIRRDSLDDVDLGYGFLERFWAKGYAFESATAILRYARETIGLARVVAITTPHNTCSIRLLEKLGLRFDRVVALSDNAEGKLFTTDRVPSV